MAWEFLVLLFRRAQLQRTWNQRKKKQRRPAKPSAQNVNKETRETIEAATNQQRISFLFPLGCPPFPLVSDTDGQRDTKTHTLTLALSVTGSNTNTGYQNVYRHFLHVDDFLFRF